MNYEEQAGKKRKYPSSEEPSIQIDDMESLEKVKEEHLGYNSGNAKGIVIDISDDDEVPEPQFSQILAVSMMSLFTMQLCCLSNFIYSNGVTAL